MSTQRSSHWSITINNPTSQDEEEINLARQKGWTVEGQLEKGENGTPHYQLYVKTPQVRFSAVKKQFKRAHIEIARNAQALQQYVHKEETREGELHTASELYPSMARVWELFYEHIECCSERYYEIEEARERLRREPLVEWDKFISEQIARGLYVEHIGVNPQNRSIVTHYWLAIMQREATRRTAQRQETDRQTVSSVATDEILSEQE